MSFVRLALSTVIDILLALMFISAIASWIPQVRQSKIGYYLFMVTEPIVAPMRRLLNRIPAIRGLPIDLSFIAACLVLSIVQQIIWMF